MKKKIKKIKFWILKRLMSKNDLQLMLLGNEILDDYINNRKTRRKIKDTQLENKIKHILKNW
jgi:hypothetical protein